ncbi:MAG: hypothetical protein HQL41_19390 [Alphaproteobacteria bacterium]|nr:hypothetical protein [Alphaproteobacteria bacterium]
MEAARLIRRASYQRRPEILDKPVTGAQREGAVERPDVQRLGRAQRLQREEKIEVWWAHSSA